MPQQEVKIKIKRSITMIKTYAQYKPLHSAEKITELKKITSPTLLKHIIKGEGRKRIIRMAEAKLAKMH